VPQHAPFIPSLADALPSDSSADGAPADRRDGAVADEGTPLPDDARGASPDGCGGLLDCGSCQDALPDARADGGAPEDGAAGEPADVGVCVPATCASYPAACGYVSDGCAGWIFCWTCQDAGPVDGAVPDTDNDGPAVVDAASRDGAAVTDACTPLPCALRPGACGAVLDGCGRMLFCGPCEDMISPSDGSADGVDAGDRDGAVLSDACVAKPCAPDDCGAVPDGCGGLRECPPCPDAGPSDAAQGDAEGDDACVPQGCAPGSCGTPPDGCGGRAECPPCGCPLTRGDEPFILRGDAVPGLIGVAPSAVRAFRWSQGAFVEVAAQADERVNRWLSPLASELSYVFQNWGEDMEVEDDGLIDAIDADDEIVFLANGTGAPAPADAWVPGAAATRQEVTLTDPLDGCVGTVYLFSSLPPTSLPAIDYQRTDLETDEATIEAAAYRAHYANRWALDEIAAAGCADWCDDLIDRLKGRAFSLDVGENEDQWAATSTYMGDLAGPVRAIREVRGAMSGVSTTYIAEYYRDRIVNTDYLRVHPLHNIWRYFDYHQDVGNLRYSDETIPEGVAIDGFDDPVTTDLKDHYQVTSYADTLPAAQGTLVHLSDLVDISAVQGGLSELEWYYQDQAAFDDRTGDVPPRAWGNAGIHVLEVCTNMTQVKCNADPDQACCPLGTGSESHPIIGRNTTVVLPPAVFQPWVAPHYRALKDAPLQASVSEQTRP
jgi:hypothetical protein